MLFKKGNEIWKARTTLPLKKVFERPENLWSAACEYFQWNDDNPLYEQRVMSTAMNDKGYIRVDVPKMRAMTIAGLCTFLGITTQAWDKYMRRQEYTPTCKAIQSIIFQQKFTGAAAGFLNYNIIARELGLKDRREFTGVDGGPIQTVQLDPEKYAEIRRQMLEGDDC